MNTANEFTARLSRGFLSRSSPLAIVRQPGFNEEIHGGPESHRYCYDDDYLSRRVAHDAWARTPPHPHAAGVREINALPE